jgi:hypothetical protein
MNSGSASLGLVYQDPRAIRLMRPRLWGMGLAFRLSAVRNNLDNKGPLEAVFSVNRESCFQLPLQPVLSVLASESLQLDVPLVALAYVLSFSLRQNQTVWMASAAARMAGTLLDCIMEDKTPS